MVRGLDDGQVMMMMMTIAFDIALFFALEQTHCARM